MNAIRNWIFTIPYITIFFAILLIFHIPLMLARLVSQKFLRKILYLMNVCILTNLKISAGVRYYLKFSATLPTDRPLIIVSNHQSMYDIPLHIVHLKKHTPRFIAKRELAKWIPSISFALRNIHCAIIDRGDHRQALTTITELGRSIADTNGTACIFPEGTRARDGRIKRFKPAGLLALLDAAPNALLVPVAIDGMWEVLKFNFKPVPYGVKVHYSVLEPIEPNSIPRDQICSYIQDKICHELGQPLPTAEFKPQRLIKP